MKKTLFSTIFLVVIAIGCSKNSSSTTGSIVGKWRQINQISWNEPTSGAINKDTVVLASSSYINFGSNGSYYEYDAYTNGQSADSSSGTYSLNGNTLTLNSPSSPFMSLFPLTVKSLTNTSMTLYFKIPNSLIGSDGSTESWINLVKE